MTVALSTGKRPFLQRQDCLKQSSLMATGLGLEGGLRMKAAVATAQKCRQADPLQVGEGLSGPDGR